MPVSIMNRNQYFFVSDLHGSLKRYEKLFRLIFKERPQAVFIGGDLTPSGFKGAFPGDFVKDVVVKGFSELKTSMKDAYPEVFIILGNDDAKQDEKKLLKAEQKGLWKYAHNRMHEFSGRRVFGYSFIPPTPFLMKDWEKYDVSRYVDPGCISPEEGKRTEKIEPNVIRYSTIKKDLEILFGDLDVSDALILFHSPPYGTNLDRAALDGKFYDSAPLDVHVGSIAIREFIEEKQPLITMHGHIHESARLTSSWRDIIGKTRMYSAAGDSEELSVVKFDPDHPDEAVRILL
jgi:Icc-related predicted phosphoesterase